MGLRWLSSEQPQRPGLETTPELLQWIRAALLRAAGQPVKDCASPLAAEPFSRMAAHHGCFNLVATEMTRQGVLDGRLRQRYLGTSVAAISVLHALKSVYNLLASEGIHPVVFKGNVLSAVLWGDPSLRDPGDIDLLVEPGEVSRTLELLKRLAYGVPGSRDDRRISTAMRFHPEISLSQADSDVTVDLHWSLLPPYYPLAKRIKQLSCLKEAVNVGGAIINTLRPEANLIALSIHGAKHSWARLAWVVDIARLLATQTVDPQSCVRLSRDMDVSDFVLSAVLLAREILGDAINPMWERSFWTPKMSKLSSHAQSLALAMMRGQEEQFPTSSAAFLALLSNPLDKVAGLVSPIVVPGRRDWEWIDIPSPMSSAYLVLRPIRVVLARFRHIATNLGR